MRTVTIPLTAAVIAFLAVWAGTHAFVSRPAAVDRAWRAAIASGDGWDATASAANAAGIRSPEILYELAMHRFEEKRPADGVALLFESAAIGSSYAHRRRAGEQLSHWEDSLAIGEPTTASLAFQIPLFVGASTWAYLAALAAWLVFATVFSFSGMPTAWRRTAMSMAIGFALASGVAYGVRALTNFGVLADGEPVALFRNGEGTEQLAILPPGLPVVLGNAKGERREILQPVAGFVLASRVRELRGPAQP